MALKVNNLGEIDLLNTLRLNWGTLIMGLFSADHMPANGDTLATYVAIEATFPGYARQNVMNWLVPVDDGFGRAKTVADLLTFTRSVTGPPANVWGYFIISPGGVCLWAERHPSPPVILEAMGDLFLVTPAFTLKSEF